MFVVDIVGVVRSAAEVTTIQARATGKEIKKRDLNLVDDSESEIRLTIWGTQVIILIYVEWCNDINKIH